MAPTILVSHSTAVVGMNVGGVNSPGVDGSRFRKRGREFYANHAKDTFLSSGGDEELSPIFLKNVSAI